MGPLMTTDAAVRPTATLVWVDAREAVLIRMEGDRTWIERVESEVPAHHRATGHVRHDPAVRHGGGGGPQTAGEPHRLEHLKRFIAEVANRLPAHDPLLILGPGSVHERLMQHLTERDGHRGRQREMRCGTAPRLTDRQLIARLRRFAGVEPRRRSVGAYRWSEPSLDRRFGHPALPPRRVVKKPASERRHGTPAE